jgi:inosine triphosphate pyrophosphatase
MDDLMYITGNKNKAKFLAENLGIEVEHINIDLEEIQSLDGHQVVEHKVRQSYKLLNRPVLVEDSGLSFVGMNGKLPGTFVKWFLQEIGDEGLVRLADGLHTRAATAWVIYALYDGKKVRFFEGYVGGRIADEVYHGGGGFGFDTIFINEGFDKPRAAMTDEEYVRTSARTPALADLRTFLTKA